MVMRHLMLVDGDHVAYKVNRLCNLGHFQSGLSYFSDLGHAHSELMIHAAYVVNRTYDLGHSHSQLMMVPCCLCSE